MDSTNADDPVVDMYFGDSPTNADEQCYCVCHSEVSSNAYCEHCKGINEVGAVHNPRLKALIRQEVLRAEAEVCKKVVNSLDETFDPVAGYLYCKDRLATIPQELNGEAT